MMAQLLYSKKLFCDSGINNTGEETYAVRTIGNNDRKLKCMGMTAGTAFCTKNSNAVINRLFLLITYEISLVETIFMKGVTGCTANRTGLYFSHKFILHGSMNFYFRKVFYAMKMLA